MANRHFGKLAELWKHLPLCELLDAAAPSLYAETHAGAAAYAAVHDTERAYGVERFAAIAGRDPTLVGARYRAHLGRLSGGDLGDGLVPGSGLLALLELGARAEYLLCDVDPGSTADLTAWARRLGVAGRAEIVTGDGMSAVAERVLAAPAGAFVHVDPYDPAASDAGGMSAVDLTAQLVTAGAAVMYWYGYDTPDARAWAAHQLHAATGAALWCGDLLVTARDGTLRDDGHLGTATTPGTGCGIVVANVERPALDRCAALGVALARAYHGAPLPSGRPGALDFAVSVTTARTARRR